MKINDKEKRKKDREKKKEELKHLEKMFAKDENGNKRTRAQINSLILDSLNNGLEQESNLETYSLEQTKTKYKYYTEKKKIKIMVDGIEKEITQVLEKDFL